MFFKFFWFVLWKWSYNFNCYDNIVNNIEYNNINYNFNNYNNINYNNKSNDENNFFDNKSYNFDDYDNINDKIDREFNYIFFDIGN